MRKQIYRAAAFFTFFNTALTAGAICLVLYNRYPDAGGFIALALPASFCAWIASLVVGRRFCDKLAERLAAPINEADFEESFIPPYDEIVPFARAVAARRASADARIGELKARSKSIKAVMENMNEGAVLLDGRGTILSANKRALKIFEMENIEMRGRNIIELLRDAELLEAARSALSGTRAETDAERGGRFYRAYFSPAAGAGAILLFLDITERIKSENLRKEFSANVSHELKTPLTSVLGCAELLLTGGVEENDKQAFYRKIKSETERLIALIEDIMALSKLDEGKKSEFAKINLTAAATEAAEALSVKSAEMGVNVEVSGEDFFIRGNYSMAVELFYNLIDNAIKYNKPGGAATVSISNENGRVAARVADTGIGIPKESQERIFERFYRVDKSRSKKTGGTGLGLAIAKHIAIIHNAEVGVESREGAGTTVTVFFPSLEDS